MIKDAIIHVVPAKSRTRKRPFCEHFEFVDNRENNKLYKSYPLSSNLKVGLTMQSFSYENVKVDRNSSKNLVIESAGKTENRTARGMMDWKSNVKDCVRSMNKLDTGSSLSGAHYSQGDGYELNKVDCLVKKSVSSSRNEFNFYHEGAARMIARDGKVSPFTHETQIVGSTSICDPQLKPEATENQEIEVQLEEEVKESSASGERRLTRNQDQTEHLFSDVDISKHVSATVVHELDSLLRSSHPSLEIVPTAFLRRKLLILDVNGLLADVVCPPPKECKGDINILRRAIFKRPFYQEFLRFCFERFDVGIWSSRSKKIVDRVVDYLLGDMKAKLLFCWDMSQCTETGFHTLENRHKPLICKELRKIWEKDGANLPWEKGSFDESNTLLLDDSPYKALFNPVHTAVFPYSFSYKNRNDTALGPGGDLRVYVENLACTDNMKKYVEQHPFGQSCIDETSSCWDFYSKVLCDRSVVSTPSHLENGLSR